MSKRRLTAAIADDDPYLRELLRVLLRSDIFDVVGEASKGDAAVELCTRLRPVVTLLDINMPVKDGLAVLDDLKAAGYPGKVVMISAEATLDRIKLAIEKGAVGFIVKPFKPGKVLDELRLCLQKK